MPSSLRSSRPDGLRPPEELLAIGLNRSRVVIMNEAHSGMQRCVHTREIGLRLLPAAPRCWGEAHGDGGAYGLYLAQPEMQRLIDGAKELGWRLIPYEVSSLMTTNEREEEQARNLTAAFAQLPKGTPLLVWCAATAI